MENQKIPQDKPAKKGRPNKFGENIKTKKLQLQVPEYLYDQINNLILSIIDAELLKIKK